MNTYNQRQNFNSPPMAYQAGHQYQSRPNMPQGNQRFIARGSPYTRSPIYNNSSMHLPRNSPPFYQGSRPASRSFHNSTGSPEQWSVHSNQSFSSDSGSSSRFGDVSQMSPYSSPHRNSGSPYFQQNRNKRFQEKDLGSSKRSKSDRFLSRPVLPENIVKTNSTYGNNYQINQKRFDTNIPKGNRSFQSSGSNNSNPGHSRDIRLYVDKSMLEDPWKDLVAKLEKKSS